MQRKMGIEINLFLNASEKGQKIKKNLLTQENMTLTLQNIFLQRSSFLTRNIQGMLEDIDT